MVGRSSITLLMASSGLADPGRAGVRSYLRTECVYPSGEPRRGTLHGTRTRSWAPEGWAGQATGAVGQEGVAV